LYPEIDLKPMIDDMANRNSVKQSVLLVFLSKGGIGEVILQTPFFRSLKKSRPELNIEMLVSRHNVGVLQNNPNIKKIHAYSDAKNLLTTIFRLRETRFSHVFIFDKSWKSNYLIRLLVKSSCYIGFKRRWWESALLTQKVHYKAEKHDSQYYIDMIPWNIPEYHLLPEMFVNDDEKKYVDSLIHKSPKLICLLPGGARNPGVGDEPFRRWAVENYIELSQKLIEHGYEILFVGNDTDNLIVQKILTTIDEDKKDRVFNVCGKLSLSQSGYAIGKAQLVVCHDSGLMHLASCFNDNLICLFGITSPVSLLPQRANVDYIWTDQDIYSPDVRIFGTYKINVRNRDLYFKRIDTDRVYQLAVRKMPEL
jgi:heptosyltransferase-2